MARDILLGTSSRNWARSPESTVVAGVSTSDKIALGGMALGTLLGLAFITHPWWSRSFVPLGQRGYHHTDYTGIKLDVPSRPVRG